MAESATTRNKLRISLNKLDNVDIHFLTFNSLKLSHFLQTFSVQTVMQKGWPLVLGVASLLSLCVCLNFFGIFFWVQTDMQKGWPLVFWTGNAKCKCKMQIQMKKMPQPKIFTRTQIFCPNLKFSPEPKIFART